MSHKTIDTTVPCYECTKRCRDCHSSCAEYKNYRAEVSAKAKAIRVSKAKEEMVNDVRFSTLQKVTGKKPKANIWKG